MLPSQTPHQAHLGGGGGEGQLVSTMDATPSFSWRHQVLALGLREQRYVYSTKVTAPQLGRWRHACKGGRDGAHARWELEGWERRDAGGLGTSTSPAMPVRLSVSHSMCTAEGKRSLTAHCTW